MKKCKWKRSYNHKTYYATQCGHSFEFDKNGVEESSFKFCFGCGKEIKTWEKGDD